MNLEELASFASQTARGAGALLRLAYQGVSTIEHKDRIDLVTDADHNSERYIIKAIREHYPTHTIVAEESGEHIGQDDWRWLVDPLDGTVNFAHRIPHFCILLALQELIAGHYQTRLGVIYDPLRDDLYTASPHHAQLNGKDIHVSKTQRLKDAMLSTGFSSDRLTNPSDNHGEFCRLNLISQGVRRFGSAGLDLAYVACGRYDMFWEHRLKPWDLAAGAFLVEQAGGKITTVDNKTFCVNSQSVLASNALVHNESWQGLLSAQHFPINSRDGLEPFFDSP
jgi:myo-inositol-1(or 4)-monophosphatase